ncbi:MAG: VWA domain-containing protein [Campylobacterales bacterium]|nr:VWA domain-containing protein [Campylobacterales bacterium]
MANNEEYLLRQEELVDNPTSRVPICLVLDISASMSGASLDELQEGVSMFFNAIRSDEIARYAAEIAIVTFGGTVKKALEFYSIERQEIPIFEANGATPMGEAVELGLSMLEHRKLEYKNAGVDYYQPWMVIMTDGAPTDNISNAVSQITEMLKLKKLTIFPIGIGQYANLDVLAQLSPGRSPLKLKGLNFKEFFLWLSRSVSKVSQSMPGEEIKLDIEGLKDWATL